MGNEPKVGRVVLMMPKDICPLDREIMSYISNEVKKLICDGMSDLYEYGTGNDIEVEVFIQFTKKGGIE